MFEILMSFEEFPTIYLEHFLLLYKCLIISCPVPLTDIMTQSKSTVQQDIYD